MYCHKYKYSDISATIALKIFETDNGCAECHAMIQLTDPNLPFVKQLENLCKAANRCQQLLDDTPGEPLTPRLKRYFLSDIANQAYKLPAEDGCAVSIVGQPPLNGTKAALWIYFKEESNPHYQHLWRTGLTYPHADSEKATVQMLELLDNELSTHDASLADNCMRTWLFVRDVDVNYHGVVVGRNKVFDRIGLTPHTHFIASTGIGGVQDSPSVFVSMDAYSIVGIDKEQVKYLYATNNLSPTSLYGVAFERGTSITYGDRRHVLISGTASIDRDGQVLYPEDIEKQTNRTIENVAALLTEADTSWEDVMHVIVYLRDTADYAKVNAMLSEKFKEIPHVIVLAPVCRPAWLIEMECMAAKATTAPFPRF